MSGLMMGALASQRIVWDEVGQRAYHMGIDHGVVYLLDGTFAPWNGLISVEEASLREKQSFYLDGVKYLEQITPGDFSGKLRAFTYPEEFNRALGIVEVTPGLEYHDQPSQPFNLTYRTMSGNDVEGPEANYTIHLLYNLMANPEGVTYETMGSPLKPSEFSFEVSGVAPQMTGSRPTVHISLNSKDAPSDVLEAIENILYGSDSSAPRFPSINEVNTLFGALGSLIIIDNGDGTWTALDLSDGYITMLDDTTFQIDNADAEFIDATTYEISTTIPD